MINIFPSKIDFGMEVTDKASWNLANKWKLQKRLAGTRQTNGSYRRAYLKPGKQWNATETARWNPANK
jgi:hypothetical protein